MLAIRPSASSLLDNLFVIVVIGLWGLLSPSSSPAVFLLLVYGCSLDPTKSLLSSTT